MTLTGTHDKMNKLQKVALLAALVGVSAAANAVTITFGGPSLGAPDNNQTSPVAGATVIDFNAGGTIAAYGITGNANIVVGSASGQYAAPPIGNITYYLSVPRNNYSDDTLDVAYWAAPGSFNYLGLFWGSIDNYNGVQFFDGATLVGGVTGAQVIAAGTAFGNQTAPGSNRYVNLYLGDLSFTSVKFLSSSMAFEIDNLAYARVPEPGTLALLGLGLIAIGITRRKAH